MNLERQPATELAKSRILDAITSTQNAREGDLGAVEDRAPWQAAEGGQAGQETREERNLIAPQESASKEPSTVAQADREELHDDQHAGQANFDRREVELGFKSTALC